MYRYAADIYTRMLRNDFIRANLADGRRYNIGALSRSFCCNYSPAHLSGGGT